MRFWGAAGEDPSGQERVLSRVVNPLAAHVRQQAAGLLQNDLRSTPQVLGLQSRLESRGRQQDWILKCLQCGRSRPLTVCGVATLCCSLTAMKKSRIVILWFDTARQKMVHQNPSGTIVDRAVPLSNFVPRVFGFVHHSKAIFHRHSAKP
jgi:hypothetical protein